MEIQRELELDHAADDVWELLHDRDELAGWVGDDVRGVRVDEDADARRLTWTWSPDGIESTVELSLVTEGERTTVRVVERSARPAGGAIARASAVRWDDALLTLELKALTWTHRLVRR